MQRPTRKNPMRIALALIVAMIVFLGLGLLFDNRCETSCLASAFKESLAKGGNEINLAFGKIKMDSDGDVNIDSDGDASSGPSLPALPSLDGIEQIRINSVSTEWIFDQRGTAAVMTDSGRSYSRGATIKKDGDTLSIQVRPSGPKNFQLTLPESYKGSLWVSTVSGDIHLKDKLSLKGLKIETASGDIDLSGLPTEKLELHTVSGDVQMLPEENSKALSPKQYVIQTVSGDLELHVPTIFDTMSVNSISGDVHLKLPKNVTYSYKFHTVSGEFRGQGENLDVNGTGANSSAQPTTGNSGKASINFESISGNLDVEQVESFGGR